jgi:hypothetical protein
MYSLTHPHHVHYSHQTQLRVGYTYTTIGSDGRPPLEAAVGGEHASGGRLWSGRWVGLGHGLVDWSVDLLIDGLID